MEQELENTEVNRPRNQYSIIVKLDGFIQFVTGFIKGIESSKEVKVECINTCICELLEGLTGIKNEIHMILDHCNSVLQDNATKDSLRAEIADLKEQLKDLEHDYAELLKVKEK